MYRALAQTIDSLARGIRASKTPQDRKLATEYCAALAPLLASAVLGRDILRELASIEKLFGNTWFADDAPFREALANWGAFSRGYRESALSGLSLNERLLALGTVDAFEQARGSGDSREVERLLREASVDEGAIRTILGDL